MQVVPEERPLTPTDLPQRLHGAPTCGTVNIHVSHQPHGLRVDAVDGHLPLRQRLSDLRRRLPGPTHMEDDDIRDYFLRVKLDARNLNQFFRDPASIRM